jgi:hypothetical protein
VQAFRALAHGRDKVLATVVVLTTTAVLLLLLSGRAVTLEVTEGLRISWFFFSARSAIMGFALCAWRAVGVLQLQPLANVNLNKT